jgi:Family of unknown function (DUF6152)
MKRRHLLLVALLAVPLAALAHHGWSEYDIAQPLKLTGTIESLSYEHPHGSVMLKTADKTWLAVLAPPTRMEARGLPKEMLATGTTVTVEGYRNKTKPDEMRSERITIADKTIDLR